MIQVSAATTTISPNRIVKAEGKRNGRAAVSCEVVLMESPRSANQKKDRCPFSCGKLGTGLRARD